MKKFVLWLLIVSITLCTTACQTSNSTPAQPKTTSTVSSGRQDTTLSEAQPTVNKQPVTTTRKSNSVPSDTLEKATNSTLTGTKRRVSAGTPSTPTAHIHRYMAATCEQPKICSCGARAGMALGHNYIAATCTSPKICRRCGKRSGSALGHRYSNATCTSPKKCTRCNSTIGNALGHNYVSNKCTHCGKVNPDSLPVGLDKLVVIDSSTNYKYDSSSFQDTYGNNYIGVHLFGYSYSGDAYAIYNLNQKYKTFSGSIVASTALESCAYIDYYFYLDDTLIYSQTKLEKITPKIDFNINVSGGTKLTIKTKTYFKPDIVGSGYLGLGSIVNAQLKK